MLDMVVHIFIPAMEGRDRYIYVWEFQSSLVYTVSCRDSQSYIVKPCLKNTERLHKAAWWDVNHNLHVTAKMSTEILEFKMCTLD